MAADLNDRTVFFETDASNVTGTDPGWPVGMAPSRVGSSARALQGALTRDWDRRGPTLTSAGTANAQTLTYTIAPTAYVRGDTYSFLAGATNTGAATLNVNTLGAKAITKNGAQALTGGEIAAGVAVMVVYDGTRFQLIGGNVANADRANVNPIVNPDCQVAQLGTSISTPADNAYTGDGARFLGETANCNWDQVAGGAGIGSAGARIAERLTVVTTNEKFGLFRPIEAIDCAEFSSVNTPAVIFSAIIAAASSLGNIKMGILQWTGTADAISGDPISSWGADGTTPTLAANWAFLNTPTNMSVGTTAARYSVTATIATSPVVNLALFIWSDDKTTTASDTLIVSQWDLRAGAVVLPFERPLAALSLLRCQRLAPIFDAGAGTQEFMGYANSSTTFRIVIPHPVETRIAPTGATVSNATNFQVTRQGGVTVAVATLAWSASGTRTTTMTGTVASGLTAGEGITVRSNNINCRIELTGARL